MEDKRISQTKRLSVLLPLALVAALGCATLGSAPLVTGSLEVEVIVDGRADASGVTVSAGGQSAVTGSDGRVLLENLPAGEPLTVRAALDGSSVEELVTLAPDELLAITLTLSVTSGSVTISSFRVSPPGGIPAGGTATVSVTAEDSAGGELFYEWEISDGWTIDASGDSATIGAPNEAGVEGRVTVIVSSDGGASVTATSDLLTIDCDEPAGLACELLAWSVRHAITVRTDQVDEPLQNVPILLALEPGRIDYAAADASGADLRIVDAALETFLDHEIDTWNPGGVSHVWLRLPELPAGSDDVTLYLYYGNAEAEDAQNPAGVWSEGFRAVWHASPVGNQMLDSSAHANDATSPLADWSDRITSALIGRAVEMENVVDSPTYFEPPFDASLDLTESFTLEAIVNIDEAWGEDPEDWAIVLKGPDVGSNNFERYYLGISRRDQVINCRIFPAADGTQIRNDDPPEIHPGAIAQVPLGVFTYLACSYDGQTLAAYVDGANVQEHSDFLGGPLIGDAGSDRLYIGRRFISDRRFGGLVDEVRISSVARSDTWIRVQQLALDGELVIIGDAE